MLEEPWCWDQELPCWWSQGGCKASCYDHHKNHSSMWKQPFYLEWGRLDPHVLHPNNVQVDWIFVLCDPCSRPRDSQILGYHMWCWCPSSLSTLVLILKINFKSQLGCWTKPPISIYTRWAWPGLEMFRLLKELVVVQLLVPMTMKFAQVEQMKRKSPLLDQWTLSPTTLKRTKALCTHNLRGWCFTNCMNSMCLKMHITPFTMTGSMIWKAKSMIFMICWHHSWPKTILRMTDCVGL